jgi:hypothetical protein
VVELEDIEIITVPVGVVLLSHRSFKSVELAQPLAHIAVTLGEVELAPKIVGTPTAILSLKPGKAE